MAVTSLWKVSSNLNNTVKYIEDKNKTLKDIIDYANNKDKTENQYYITGINCNVDSAYEEMKYVKKIFDKENGILGFHGYQSFKEDEVTPKLAHEIGIKLANEMWGDKFQVIVSTHLNTNHIHNHFVINSVSFKDGKKYNSCRATTARLRNINDTLCEEYGLSKLDENKTKSGLEFKYYLKKDKYKNIVKRDIDIFIQKSNSYNEFIDMLTYNNYEVTNRYGKLSIRNNDYKRNIRIERAYGSEYSIDNIKQRILEEKYNYYKLDEEYISYNHYLKKNKIKTSSIISLYKYYCYLLKIYPTKYSKYPKVLKEDLEKLDMFNKINIFIDKYNIFNEETFNQVDKKLNNKLDMEYSLKRKLRREYNKTKDTDILNKIQEITIELNELKKDINISSNIKINRNDIEEKINKIEKDRKDLDKYEPIK